MQIGFIGLGKMGGNMVTRIRRDSDIEIVAFDFSADAVKAAEEHGATGSDSLEDMVGKLQPPRAVWIMVPAGKPTEDTIDKLLGMFSEGDTIIDGGNSKWTESIDRHAKCAERGVHFVDVGTSGGCLGPGDRLLHDGGRRGRGGHPAGPAVRRAGATGHRQGAHRLGAHGRPRLRPLRQDDPQRDRVRPDAGLRRGF